jgi:hypothetical protein
VKPEHLHILQHALGVDQYGRGTQYRNHYVSGPSCDGFADLRELVAMGLMVEHAPRELFGGDYCFTVTDAGRRALREHSPAPPRQTRSQKRYESFLRADSSLSFGEWLRVKREVGF